LSAENTPLEGTGEVSIPEDFAQYAEYRRTGELPKAVEDTPSEVSTDESETGTAAESETADDTEQEQEQTERDEKGRFKGKQRGLDKRFHELTSELRELREQNKQLAAKVDTGVASPKVDEPKAAEGKPESKDFDTYEEYIDKLSDWKLDQKERARAEEYQKRQQQEQQRTAAESWQKREETLREKHDDYDEALESLKIPNTAALADIREFLGESENGPELLYHLAKNPDEAKRIVELSPRRAIAELGKLEATISAPKPKTKTVSNTPAPPQTVVTKSTPAVKPLNQVDDYAEYAARRRKGER